MYWKNVPVQVVEINYVHLTVRWKTKGVEQEMTLNKENFTKVPNYKKEKTK